MEVSMATNLALDDALLAQAFSLSGFRTKRETVNAALAEYVEKRRASEIVALFGTVDYDPSYDYKALRNRSNVNPS